MAAEASDGIVHFFQYHLFVRMPGCPDRFFGWGHHASSGGSLQNITDIVRRLPVGTEWHVVDMITMQVVAGSHEIPSITQ